MKNPLQRIFFHRRTVIGRYIRNYVQGGRKKRFPCPRMKAIKDKPHGWQINRQINLSVLIQLVLLASLIVGSWVNLQRQLDLLQHDVSLLLQSQKNSQQKLEALQVKSISYEYRLQAIEKAIAKEK